MSMITRERGAAVRHAQRAAGQAFAITTMLTEERRFAEVAQQLLAARGSLDSLLVRLVELELESRVPNAQARSEIDGLLRSALGRTGHNRHAGRSSVLARPSRRARPVAFEERTSQ